MVVPIFNSLRNLQWFFLHSSHVNTLPPMVHEFSLLHTSLTLVTSWLFDSSHSHRCEVIWVCCVDLHFPDDKWCRNLFMYLLTICIYPLGKMFIWFSVHFLIGLSVFLLLRYMTSYSWETSLLSDQWFANTFSHSRGYPFILLIIPFVM